MASTSAVAQIMAKIARNCTQLGLTLTSQSSSSVVVHNASNDLTITYVASSTQAPMSGVDGSASPFLGLGNAGAGKLKLKSAIATNGDIRDVSDSVAALQVLHMLGGFANNLVVENSTASYATELTGDVDLVGMGQ